MGVYLHSKLPSEYQEVEYVQSSGTQYIDTGLPPSNNTKVQFKLSNYSINSSIQYVFGSTSRRGNNMFGLLGTTSWSGDTINGHLLYGTSEYKLSSGNIGNGGTHTGELSSNGFYVDGTRIRTVSGTFTGTLNMTIFAGNINGIIGANEKGSFKLYYFKVYESGTLVRDFVPCYRKSDDVIGLYDLVNNQFYTNSGTGTFSKGNDVTMSELKNAYIGEVHTYTFDFQNDGDLGWTITARSEASKGYTAGQGFYLNSRGYNTEFRIIPPASFFNLGIPSKIRIRGTKPTATNYGLGIGGISWDYNFLLHCSSQNNSTAIGCQGDTGNLANSVTGEVLFDMNINGNNIYGTVNSQDYSLNSSMAFSPLWTDNQFCILVVSWKQTTGYIRKMEITVNG